MYAGFAKYVPLTSAKKDSVLREDINNEWHLYNDTIFDNILDHYFLVSLKGNVLKHSLITPSNMSVIEITKAEFNVNVDGEIPANVDLCEIESDVQAECKKFKETILPLLKKDKN